MSKPILIVIAAKQADVDRNPFLRQLSEHYLLFWPAQWHHAAGLANCPVVYLPGWLKHKDAERFPEYLATRRCETVTIGFLVELAKKGDIIQTIGRN